MTNTARTSDGRTAMTEPAVFHYQKPVVGARKIGVHLARTGQGDFTIQVLNEGGENNLHSHMQSDGFYLVLGGGVRFYTTDDVLVAELKENEGILMPRGYPYWFESVPGTADLQLIRFGVTTRPGVDALTDRINLSQLKPNQKGLLEENEQFGLKFDLGGDAS